MERTTPRCIVHRSVELRIFDIVESNGSSSGQENAVGPGRMSLDKIDVRKGCMDMRLLQLLVCQSGDIGRRGMEDSPERRLPWLFRRYDGRPWRAGQDHGSTLVRIDLDRAVSCRAVRNEANGDAVWGDRIKVRVDAMDFELTHREHDEE